MTIRLYPGQKYNARVYHQRCMNCNRLSRPVLDSSYAERVTYWVKQWNGVWVEKPPISGDSKGPHNNELCEGCKAGHCSESSGALIRQLQRSVNHMLGFGSLLIFFKIDYLMYRVVEMGKTQKMFRSFYLLFGACYVTLYKKTRSKNMSEHACRVLH